MTRDGLAFTTDLARASVPLAIVVILLAILTSSRPVLSPEPEEAPAAGAAAGATSPTKRFGRREAPQRPCVTTTQGAVYP